jgi:asparagine synthase (glutamine-hydrolysing)
MPGLCALSFSNPAAGQIFIGEMLGRSTAYEWLASAERVDAIGGGAIGVVTFPSALDAALAWSPEKSMAAAVFGEFLEVEGDEPLNRERGPAERLLDGWHREGSRFLSRVNGEFAAVLWDAETKELVVVTDRFGLRPLYVAEVPGGFAAASEIKAILAVPEVDITANDQGIAQFFSFGHFYGADTLLSGIRCVPPATVGIYRRRTSTYAETRYWEPLKPETGSAADQARAFEERFIAAVERRAHPGERLGLSLSGGLDARTILGVMPAGVDLQTVSVGIEGSLDHESAAKLAGIAGVPHVPYHLDASFLSGFETHLRQMIALTDGHYLDQGIVMPTMEVYRRLGIQFLMRGHGGELLHMRKAYAFSLDDAAIVANEPALKAWLLSHLTDYMLGGTPPDLFLIDLKAGAEKALRLALSRVEAVDRPVDRVWHLFLNERLHRETALSMHLFGNFATIRQPYLDNGVVDALFAMPAAMKLGDELQTSLLRRARPAFLDVPNSNTGTRLGASPLATKIARLRLRVGAKLGLKGYQPYERLGLWLRRELADFVIRTLTSERVLDGGVVRADAIRRVVSEHIKADRNHTFLIMSLLIFVLGRETVLDPRRRARMATASP